MMTMALVASLALSAQARGPIHVSASYGNQGSHTSSHHSVNTITADYQYDDGTSENAVAIGTGVTAIEALWFNQFAVIPGANVIGSVDIAWGTPANSTPASQLNGTPVTIAIWSDPNGDGNPSDAVLLGSVPGTVQDANTDTFITYTFPTAVTVPGTSFFVGDMTPANNSVEPFIESLDQNTSAGKSWTAFNSNGAPVDINNIGNNDTVAVIDSFGIPGNWLIRANATTTTGDIVLMARARHVGPQRAVALRWSPADGGTLNILRDGVVIATAADDGKASDQTATAGSTYTYQVCETDTGNCSNEVTVVVP